MPYRILLVLSFPFDPYSGGVQMSTYKMSSYFRSQGHLPAVFSFGEKGHIQQEVATLFHVSESGGEQNPNNLEQLKACVLSYQPQIVISQMPYEPNITDALGQIRSQHDFLLLACLRNTFFTVKLNLDDYGKNLLPALLAPFFKNTIGRQILLSIHKRKHGAHLKRVLDVFDYFVLFGPPNLDELNYFVNGYKNDKVWFIPNSTPDVLPEVPGKENVLLYVGSLFRNQKKVEYLLPLWKKVVDQLPDWEFQIVGGGEEYESMEKQISTEIIPRVRLFGKQKPFPFYEKAALLVMTSSFEGFPNVIIEAQSRAAVPVVFQSYPLVSWVIEDGKNGLLVPPFDLDAMAKNIVKLAKDPDKLAGMSKAALENANRFVIDKVGPQWIDFFNNKAPQQLENE